jgi:hypothetical protein
LSDEKGDTETVPKPLVKELLESGKEGCYIVSSSNPIEDSKASREQTQPPHIQAKKCYENYLKQLGGVKFLVTMEEPDTNKPQPIIFNIDKDGITRGDKRIISAAAIITSSPAPRAG